MSKCFTSKCSKILICCTWWTFYVVHCIKLVHFRRFLILISDNENKNCITVRRGREREKIEEVNLNWTKLVLISPFVWMKMSRLMASYVWISPIYRPKITIQRDLRNTLNVFVYTSYRRLFHSGWFVVFFSLVFITVDFGVTGSVETWPMIY